MYLLLLATSQLFFYVGNFGNINDSLILPSSIPESNSLTNQNINYSSDSLRFGEIIITQSQNYKVMISHLKILKLGVSSVYCND
jgi:hypothetical protein